MTATATTFAFATGVLADGFQLPQTPQGQAASWILTALLAVIGPMGFFLWWAFSTRKIVFGWTYDERVNFLKERLAAAEADIKISNENAARATENGSRAMKANEQLLEIVQNQQAGRGRAK